MVFEKCPKTKLSFEGVLRASGAWECARPIGNGYSFVHAKYGANPYKKKSDQITFLFFGKSSFGSLGVESPHGVALSLDDFAQFA